MDSKSYNESGWTVVSHKKKQGYNEPQPSTSSGLSSFQPSKSTNSFFKVPDTSCEYEKITIKRNGQTRTYP